MTTEELLAKHDLSGFKDDNLDVLKIDVWQALAGDASRNKRYFSKKSNELIRSAERIEKSASYLAKSVSATNPFAGRLREEVEARKRQEDYAASLRRLSGIYADIGKHLARRSKK